MAWKTGLSRATLVAASVLAAPALATPAPDYRLHDLTGSVLTSLAGPSDRSQVFDLLDTSDQRSTASYASHRYLTELGPFDLTVVASKAKGGRLTDDWLPIGGDRYSMRSANIALGLGTGDQFSLQSDVLFAHMRRHLAKIETGRPRMSTNIAEAGLAIVRDAGPRFSVGYLSVTSSSRLSLFDRIGADMGGAPLPGHGFRLAFSSGSAEPRPGRVRWTLSLASMRRPLGHSGLTFGSDRIADKRAELALRMSF